MLNTTDSITLSEQEIEEMREGGKIWQQIKQELVNITKEGVTGKYINDKALELFNQHKVETAFFNYQNFPGHICVSVNDCIVHGLGNDIPLKKTDKVTLDIGFKYKSVYIDSAVTLIVDPESNPEYKKFVDKCYKLLWAAIKAAKTIKESGNTLYNGDLASTIEGVYKSWNNKNYSIIDGYVGHTIGKAIHLKPNVFNKGLKKGEGDILKNNSVICIEPMLLEQNNGSYKLGSNGFDVVSQVKDAFTCHWEHMVLIKEDGVEVLTATPEELQEML